MEFGFKRLCQLSDARTYRSYHKCAANVSRVSDATRGVCGQRVTDDCTGDCEQSCSYSLFVNHRRRGCRFSARELTFTFAICYRPSVCLSSVVCNAHAPYSGASNFRKYFYGVRCLGHPLTSTENFTEIVPEEPLRRGS